MDWSLHQELSDGAPSKNKNPPITVVEFNSDGEFLAYGTSEGKVSVFQKQHNKNDYQLYHTFVAHTPGFDSLKSINISEGLTGLQWLPKISSTNLLLTSNEKVVNLWKMGIKKLNKLKTQDTEDGSIVIPTIETYDKAPFTAIYKSYENGHPFSIHSISINSDGETFISSDDLSINLWNFENTSECFNIVNHVKPNVEDISEVITCSVMHPVHCNIMMWGSSQGTIHLADLRESSLIRNAKVFQDNGQEESFFFQSLPLQYLA